MGELYLTSLVVLCRQTKSHVTPPVAVLVAGPSTVFSLRAGDTAGGVKFSLLSDLPSWTGRGKLTSYSGFSMLQISRGSDYHRETID